MLLHCAAGIRVPIEEIINQYEKKYDVRVETLYSGSGKLLSEIRLNGGAGDLYLAADVSYMEDAAKYDLIDEVAPIASQSPCIAIREGGVPVSSLADLANENVKLSLADPKIAAISRVAKKMLGDARIGDQPAWDVLFEKAIVTQQRKLPSHMIVALQRQVSFSPRVHETVNKDEVLTWKRKLGIQSSLFPLIQPL